MMRAVRGLLGILMIVLCLSGCGFERAVDPVAVVEEMAAAGGKISGNTVGKLYQLDRLVSPADEQMLDGMPESLIAAAFGGGDTSFDLFSRFEAYAVWMCSFAEPIEYGCFIVAREGDAEETAKMCLRRADEIRTLCGEAVCTPPPLVIGRYVFYAVGEGAEFALATARDAIRG